MASDNSQNNSAEFINLPMIDGDLFKPDFLQHGIIDIPEYKNLKGSDIFELKNDLKDLFHDFMIAKKSNESQTEEDLIWPILERLGWTETMRQQNLSQRGRSDVPDGILFLDKDAKDKAKKSKEEWESYNFGAAIVEAKKWNLNLDRRCDGRAPSSQMVRYMRGVDHITNTNLRWGILTNGRIWRIYYSGAGSIAEEYFEVDLASILDIKIDGEDAPSIDINMRSHLLKIFHLMFRPEGFKPEGIESKTFHEKSMDGGKFYEERVAQDLSGKVFHEVFPNLVKSIVESAPDADLQDVRQAAMTLLYRLLFVLYAEDRDLLPVNDKRYHEYGLRQNVRLDIGKRKDQDANFSDKVGSYWSRIKNLFTAIHSGDSSIGLPAYSGGLFDSTQHPLLDNINIPDSTMADIIDALSFDKGKEGRKYINYRNLSVRQLGSIYERLLEYDVIREDGEIIVKSGLSERKDSGSYYTPDDLVQMMVKETLNPLIDDCYKRFVDKVKEMEEKDVPIEEKQKEIMKYDPATAILNLTICDPACGSGHFLVGILDFLADEVINAMAYVKDSVSGESGKYISPLGKRIDNIRDIISSNANLNQWQINEDHLDDKNIIRKMVLKQSIYGVDKNPMAIELTKMSLWLHTFTTGAPLSFIDHHLRCGNSLFGENIENMLQRLQNNGQILLINDALNKAYASIKEMQKIENMTDADIQEADLSAKIFDNVIAKTKPLDDFMKTLHAIDWLMIKDKEGKSAISAWLDGQFGNPVDIAHGKKMKSNSKEFENLISRFKDILEDAKKLIKEENFFNWEVGFPGIWQNSDNNSRNGFDAIIGNPIWGTVKVNDLDFFAESHPDIVAQTKADDRKKMIAVLEANDDPVFEEYSKAVERAETTSIMAKKSGNYPLMSKGDLNYSSLFVEQGMNLLNENGIMGFLTPSGIVSDKNTSDFFKYVTQNGHLKALYDFENRRTRHKMQPFFKDVHSRLKFSTIIASRDRVFDEAKCGFYMQHVSEIHDKNRCIPFTADEFKHVNPNTGSALIFRSRRDADIVKNIHSHTPVLLNESNKNHHVRTWPVKYQRMFDMSNDSDLFATRKKLEKNGDVWPLEGNILENASGKWHPLYVGKMFNQFDHRASSVAVNKDNKKHASLAIPNSIEQKSDPFFIPEPQYWVKDNDKIENVGLDYMIGYRNISNPTNARTMIASLLPRTGAGHSIGLLSPMKGTDPKDIPLMLANLNSIVLDFVLRRKITGTNVTWNVVKQLPVIPIEKFEQNFGSKSAADIIREIVLELTYTAHDMAPFARDMGYVDGNGDVLPPFAWDEDRRRYLTSKLDAVFFHLYDVTNRDDIRYIYSTFRVKDKEKNRELGESMQMTLNWFNALNAGRPDANIAVKLQLRKEDPFKDIEAQDDDLCLEI